MWFLSLWAFFEMGYRCKFIHSLILQKLCKTGLLSFLLICFLQCSSDVFAAMIFIFGQFCSPTGWNKKTQLTSILLKGNGKLLQRLKPCTVKQNSYSSSAIHPKHNTHFSYLQPGDHQIPNKIPWIFNCYYLCQHQVPCNSQDKQRSSILTFFNPKPDTIRPKSWP